MFKQGPIPVALHALAEPFLAALFIAAPFLFGFSDVSSATAVSIIVGVAVLLVGMSTKWRLSLIKAIPLEVHAMLDLGVGALLIAAPFLFGYSDESAPTAFSIVMGVLLMLSALGTRWTPATDARGARTAAVSPVETSGTQPTTGRFARSGAPAEAGIERDERVGR